MAFAFAPARAGALAAPQAAGKRVNVLRSSASAFTGRACAAKQIKHQARGQSACARAYLREYPDPQFIEEVKAAFPDKGIANAEEARVLFSNAGYTYLDVRPSLELSEAGKVKACVNIPIVNSKWVYNKELRKKEMVKEPNASFVADVQKRFPNTEAPLLIACSDGRTYSIDALEALDEAGYTNLVGLRGGYYNWYATWDANLRRRRNGEYAEQYTHDGDSCGIHSSGAGFERVDSVEKWAPPKF